MSNYSDSDIINFITHYQKSIERNTKAHNDQKVAIICSHILNAINSRIAGTALLEQVEEIPDQSEAFGGDRDWQDCECFAKREA